MGGGEGVVMHSQSSMAHHSASQVQPITHEVDYAPPRSVLRGFAEIAHVEQGALLASSSTHTLTLSLCR